MLLNKAVRRILKLPYRTHTGLLGPLLNQQHVKMQFQIQILRFVHKMLNNTNNVISCISRLANYSSGRNMSYLRFKYDVNFTDGLHVNLTRLNNAEFPDLTRQGLINVVTYVTNLGVLWPEPHEILNVTTRSTIIY